MPVSNNKKLNTVSRSLSLMVKPASSRCNMNCSYCFYKAEAGRRETPDRGFLSEADSDLLIHRLAEYLQPGDVLDIGFQGGEPSLLPAPFYQDFAGKLESTCPAEIHWYFQTNGLLIDEAFCAFFREHHVLVGLSLDMEEGFHDLYRKDSAGKGTWKQIMKTKKMLDRERIDYNILSVLTPSMARHPDKVWNFIRREDLRYVQFLPAFHIPSENQTFSGNNSTTAFPSDREPAMPTLFPADGSSCGLPDRYAEKEISCCSLTPDLYAHFYERLAQLWLETLKKGEYYSVKLFDDLVHLLRGEGIHSCGLCGACEPQLILEADLSAYPCDFYCTDGFLLGNLQEQEIGTLLEAGLPFRNRNRLLPPVCAGCRFREFCNGGCPVLFPFTCSSSPDSGSCGYQKFLLSFLPEIKKSGLF